MKKIPKVFISYAWTSKNYEQKVLDFAYKLQDQNGIEVVIDKWAVSAGNDIMSFMERSVNDNTIDFVLILLNKQYAEKADCRKGGVGDETQILSPKVYKSVNQNRIIPIVFERDENNEICKPTYLSTRLYFDLTSDDAENEFKKLVKHIHGEPIYSIPPIGNKPDWVSAPIRVLDNTREPLNQLKDKNIRDRKRLLIKIFDNILLKLKDSKAPEFSLDPNEGKKCLDFFYSTKEIRDTYLEVIDETYYEPFFLDLLTEFLEKFYGQISHFNKINDSFSNEVKYSLLQEIAIYTIALLWRYKEYKAIFELLTRTYLVTSNLTYRYDFDSLFYSTQFLTINVLKKIADNKEYFSGEAQLWIERLNGGFSKDEFVFADLLICNLTAFYGKGSVWFPKLYPYAGERFHLIDEFIRFAYQFKSKSQINKLHPLLGTIDINEIKNKLTLIQKNYSREYRYPNTYTSAPFISDVIKIEDVGSLE